MQDLNEIFNRRRERAMHKIQLNKNTKHSREKKNSAQSQQTELKEETVDCTNSKIRSMQRMQEWVS